MSQWFEDLSLEQCKTAENQLPTMTEHGKTKVPGLRRVVNQPKNLMLQRAPRIRDSKQRAIDLVFF